MPRSPSPYRDRRYRDSPPRRFAPRDRDLDRDWDRDRDRGGDRDRDRSWGNYNRQRDTRDRQDPRDRPRGRDWDDDHQDRPRSGYRDRGGRERSPSPRPTPRSPAKSRVTSASGGRSASPEEGQIMSPVRSNGARPIPIPIPFYRDRMADRRDLDYDRRSRYPPGPSRRSRSPSPRNYSRRRRSRSRSQSSYSYSTRSRSSPDKSQSPRRRGPSQPRDVPPPPREGVGFPSIGRAPPSGPRSDRLPPAGPRALSGDYPNSGPSRAPVNPYSGPIDRKPQVARPIPPDVQARSSPLNPTSPAGAMSPIARVSTPQEVDNPYARPIGAGSTPGSAHTRLSWAERKAPGPTVSPAQAKGYSSPLAPADPQGNDRMGQVKIEPNAGRSPRKDAGIQVEEDTSVPIVKQDPEVLARMQIEARIRSELPDIKLWSTKPKWEMDLAAHYAHLASLQQTTLRAQSAARMTAAAVADAEAERIAAGERRKVAEAQLMSSTIGVGILGSLGA